MRIVRDGKEVTPVDFGADPEPLQLAKREDDFIYYESDRSADMLGIVLTVMAFLAFGAICFVAGKFGWM